MAINPKAASHLYRQSANCGPLRTAGLEGRNSKTNRLEASVLTVRSCADPSPCLPLRIADQGVRREQPGSEYRLADAFTLLSLAESGTVSDVPPNARHATTSAPQPHDHKENSCSQSQPFEPFLRKQLCSCSQPRPESARPTPTAATTRMTATARELTVAAGSTRAGSDLGEQSFGPTQLRASAAWCCRELVVPTMSGCP